MRGQWGAQEDLIPSLARGANTGKEAVLGAGDGNSVLATLRVGCQLDSKEAGGYAILELSDALGWRYNCERHRDI